MNPNLALLQAYPFERMRDLLEGIAPPQQLSTLKLTIGEPQHAPPDIVIQCLREQLELLSRYPSTKGELRLREAQAQWLSRRHAMPLLDPETQLVPVNGTREALFAIAQTCVAAGRDTLVGCPNPFYQIYEGAALLAGAKTVLIDTPEDADYLPDPEALSTAQWDAMQLLYLCTPGNPSGAVMDTALLQRFITKAIRHNVVLVSDECYSEIYADEQRPPSGLLAACAALGVEDYRNCISMHSLSKRSNLPGLRSGFAAGDASIIKQFLQYRSYHGCAMPLHHQRASAVAWNDEAHVIANRQLYREKFAAVNSILDPVLALNSPAGGFYLWPRVAGNDQAFARELYRQSGVIVLPGSFLGREGPQGNPGVGRVRIALVTELSECTEAAQRIAAFVSQTKEC
ncbi:MAG: succinyldiaminopimelate transaminase [Congregibacter sp.]